MVLTTGDAVGIFPETTHGWNVKLFSVFNNKGGVGKTTLTFHLASALAESGKKVLLIDLDPQCNLTLYGFDEHELENLWLPEDDFIEDYLSAQQKIDKDKYTTLVSSTRSIHFLLKPTQDGVDPSHEISSLPPPKKLRKNLDLIPGRLTLHQFEDRISKRWNDVYQGDPLAIRTITRIRNIATAYSDQFGYDFVITDTSPSLGILNKVIISTSDGFFVPCMPDLFSLYGIKNISLFIQLWKKEFDTIYSLLPTAKREQFPKEFVHFLGYTIYNAKKSSNKTNDWDLVNAHFSYAKKIASMIKTKIPASIKKPFSDTELSRPIGLTSVMHGHQSMATMAQKYRKPIWELPAIAKGLDDADIPSIIPNKALYEQTKDKYKSFSKDLIKRLNKIG